MPLPCFKLCTLLFAAEPEGAGGKSDRFGATSAAPLVVQCFQPCASTHGRSVSTAAAAATRGGQAFVPSSEGCSGRLPPPVTLNRDNRQSHPPGASCWKASSGLVEQDRQGKGCLAQGRDG